MHVRQAVVLVGGKGTRLGPLTARVPKPLLEIAPGQTFLDVLLFDLARYGFSDIILLAGHLGDQVVQAYQGRNILDARVEVIREPEPQGTGGALLFARDRLDPWFVMANGDSFFDINFRDLTRNLDDGFEARLALREVTDPGRYGSVFLAGDTVTGFREKDPTLAGPGLINGGVYVLNRRALDRISGPCSIEQDIFPKLAADNRLRGQRFEGYFLDIGLPYTYDQAQRQIPARARRPCAFLDRDGVLNRDEHGYSYQPDKLEWMPGAREGVRHLNEAGYLVVVVSNQSGVARGYFTEDDVRAFHAHMNRELAKHGAHVDAFYYCPHHEDGVTEQYRIANHPDRKPNPGMIHRAFADLPIVKSASFLIGDKQSDIEAATAAGVPGHMFKGGNFETLVTSLVEANLR